MQMRTHRNTKPHIRHSPKARSASPIVPCSRKPTANPSRRPSTTSTPRAGLTAWQALFDHGKLAKGQTVIIHGAGGAVGSTAVQLARWSGAQGIETGRSPSRSLVTELGADRFVALDADRLEDAADQADLVFDTIGREVH